MVRSGKLTQEFNAQKNLEPIKVAVEVRRLKWGWNECVSPGWRVWVMGKT